MQYNTLFKWGMFSIKEVILTHLGIFKAETLSRNSISRLDKNMNILSFLISAKFLVFSLSAENLMKTRENLMKNQNNGLMRSFLTGMQDEFDEPSAVSDLREVVYEIKTGQVNERPKISDFIIE